MMAFPIPNAALDDRLGFVGTSGSGKTYNASAAVEHLMDSGARVVIVDPLDVWWGLRLSADGKKQAFALPIFGGAHGDLPLNERAGKLIGETVATMSESCIISLGGMPTKESERRFMLDFLETLYRKAAGEPFHMIFDEADLWAPQGTGSGSGPKLQSLMEQIVRRGRVKGFIPWLITQRSAAISKDVLSQVDGLIIFKLTSSNDRKAIGEWVKGQADPGEWDRIWAKLPAMQQGEGIVWVPARQILSTVRFPAKATFNSSAAPKRGEKRQRTGIAPLDLADLKGKLASIEGEARANDPAALKAEIVRLRRELVKASSELPPMHNSAEILKRDDQIASLTAELAEMSGALERLTASAKELHARQAKALAALTGEPVAVPDSPASRQIMKRVPRQPSPPPVRAGGAVPQPKREVEPPAGDVTRPQQRILDALAWWEEFGIDAPTNEQVGFAANYAPGSGNFNNLKGGLSSAGLIFGNYIHGTLSSRFGTVG